MATFREKVAKKRWALDQICLFFWDTSNFLLTYFRTEMFYLSGFLMTSSRNRWKDGDVQVHC